MLVDENVVVKYESLARKIICVPGKVAGVIGLSSSLEGFVADVIGQEKDVGGKDPDVIEKGEGVIQIGSSVAEKSMYVRHLGGRVIERVGSLSRKKSSLAEIYGGQALINEAQTLCV